MIINPGKDFWGVMQYDRVVNPDIFIKIEPVETAWQPQIEVTENDREYIVKTELPGFTRENIEVKLEDGALMLRGNIPVKHSKKSPLQFEKTFRLANFPEDALEVHFENERLCIIVTKPVSVS